MSLEYSHKHVFPRCDVSRAMFGNRLCAFNTIRDVRIHLGINWCKFDIYRCRGTIVHRLLPDVWAFISCTVRMRVQVERLRGWLSQQLTGLMSSFCLLYYTHYFSLSLSLSIYIYVYILSRLLSWQQMSCAKPRKHWCMQRNHAPAWIKMTSHSLVAWRYYSC